MKKKIMESAVAFVKKNYPNYSDDQLSVMVYGLESIYITITKLVILTLIALILGIFKEYIIFLLIFNGVRLTAFGLHASKSIICLISSTLIFITCPIICSLVNLNIYIKIILGLITLIIFYKFAPSDTVKRPIISKTRRAAYKLLTILIAIIYIIMSVVIKDNFLSNAFIMGLIVECFMIHPLVYKLFNLPYNNYANYKFNKTAK